MVCCGLFGVNLGNKRIRRVWYRWTPNELIIRVKSLAGKCSKTIVVDRREID